MPCMPNKGVSTSFPDSALKGHVFKRLHLTDEDMCEVYCYLDDRCQSINLSTKSSRGTWKCELSSKNRTQHPESLVREEGFKYLPAIVSTIKPALCIHFSRFRIIPLTTANIY